MYEFLHLTLPLWYGPKKKNNQLKQAVQLYTGTLHCFGAGNMTESSILHSYLHFSGRFYDGLGADSPTGASISAPVTFSSSRFVSSLYQSDFAASTGAGKEFGHGPDGTKKNRVDPGRMKSNSPITTACRNYQALHTTHPKCRIGRDANCLYRDSQSVTHRWVQSYVEEILHPENPERRRAEYA